VRLPPLSPAAISLRFPGRHSACSLVFHMGGEASDSGAVTVEPVLPALPIVPRIVRRTLVDAYAVLRPIAVAERIASTRRGRVLGKLAVAALFVVALLIYARLNVQPEAASPSDVIRRASVSQAASAPRPSRPASAATTLRR